MFATFFSSADDAFPPVTLNFAGGASMNLKPSDYLLQQGSVVSLSTCFGIALQSDLINDGKHKNSCFTLILKCLIFYFQNNAIIWCIGWQKNQGGITILGGLWNRTLS